MLSLDTRIDRAQRLLRMLDEDVALLMHRVKDLAPEHQHSATKYAAQLRARTREELARLMEAQIPRGPGDPPEPAD